MSKLSLSFALTLLVVSACSGPQVAGADEVIAMSNSGTDESGLLQWVNDPQRTFDLSWDDMRELMKARVSQSVIDVMRAKSEEYHRAKGRVSGQGHRH